jgi:hypothetical protein
MAHLHRQAPALKDAISDATADKGVGKAVDLIKDSLGAHFVVHVLGGLHGIAPSIAVKATSIMERGQETPYRYLNRLDEIANKRIGALYAPQWAKLAS